MSKKFSQIFSAMLARERRTVGVVALIAVCRMFGLFALLPVLAIYAADLEAATPALIGLAVGGYGLTQAMLQIPYGAVSDRIGRVPVILFGLFLFAAGSVIAAQSTSIYGVIGGRLLQGAGAISATLSALLADATREEMRTRSMAILGVGHRQLVPAGIDHWTRDRRSVRCARVVLACRPIGVGGSDAPEFPPTRYRAAGKAS